MTTQYNATISGNVHGKKYTFSDVYNVNRDYFYSIDEIILYIKHDLMLVLGGGYSTKDVKNAKFNIYGNGVDITEIKNRIPRNFYRLTLTVIACM